MAQQTQIGSHKTSVFTEEGYTRVVYHSTCIVKFNHEEVILNSGGYSTATTKTRMNQASSQFELGYHIFQKDFDWFVRFYNQEGILQVVPFFDGISFARLESGRLQSQ